MGDVKKIIIDGKNLPAKQGTTRSERSATVTSTIDPKSIRELATVLKKVSTAKQEGFDFAGFSSKLENTLSSLFNKYFKATGQTGGISKADINRIIKEVIQVSLVDAISKAFEKQAKKGKAAGELKPSVITNAIEKSIAKMAIVVAKEVGKASKGDVTIDPTLFAGSLKSAVAPLIPKSLPQVSLGIEKSFNTVKKLMRELDLLSKSVESMRKSGGGIDLMELPKVLANLKQVGINAIELGKALVQTRKDATAVFGESSEKIKELHTAIDGVKRTIKERVASVRQSAAGDRSAVAKDVFREITKIIKSSALKDTELIRVIKSFENKISVMADLGPALKAVGTEFKTAVSVGTNIENADEFIKKFDRLISKLNVLPDKLTITGDISKEYKDFLKGMEKLSRGAKKISADVKLIIDDSELKKLQEKSIEVKTDLDITSAKDTLKTLTEDSISVPVDVDLDRKIPKKVFDLIRGAITTAIEKGSKDASKLEILKNIDKELIVIDDSNLIGLQKIVNDIEKVTGTRLKQVADQLDQLLGKLEDKASKLRSKQVIRSMGIPSTESRKYDLEALKATISIPSYKEKVIGTQKIGSIKDVFSEQSFATKVTDLNRRLLIASEKNMNELSVSLRKLQKGIIERLDTSFKEFDTGWEVSRPSGEKDPSKIFKKTDQQWTVDIVNVSRLQQMFKGVKGGPQALTGAYIADKMEKTGSSMDPRQMADAIGKWLKQTSKSQIMNWEVDIGDVAPQLLSIQKGLKGVAPDESTINTIVSAFGTNLESIFKNTYQRTEARRMMQNEKLIRTVSLPVATLTKEGAPTFQTTHGSLRALPKFGQFTSGFEHLYSRLEKGKKLDFSKEYSKRVKEVGVKPAGRDLYLAEGIATGMIKDVAAMSQESKKFILDQFKEAGTMRGLEVSRTKQLKGTEFGKEAKLFSLNIEKVVDAFAATGGDDLEVLLSTLKKMGVSAHDLVKSLDQIKFENVYDIYKKILIPETGGGPVTKLAKEPHFDRAIRELEQAVGQLAGLFPLVERNRPRRALHQGSIVNIQTRTGSMYDIGDALKPKEQKDLIKDLNIRLGEMVTEAKTLQSLSMGGASRLRKLPTGVSTLSSLGIPEEQASKVEEYRKGAAKEGTQFLKDLNATVIKMYSDILPEFAPFGAEFQQIGRNITNVTNAMISATKGAEFPKLTTEKERGVVESGFYGKKGYGFNVIAELRNTAATFEDQLVVSGKLADVVTSAVKMIVKPSIGGRVGMPTSGTVGKAAEEMAIVPGQLLKDNIKEAKREFQKILGIPQKYPGRADKAFIESVEKTLTVVRGESIEVQKAKIAEVFLNYFGRKFTTRYGSKGVGITPTKPAGQALREAYGGYGIEGVQVLAGKERKKAGLGVARLPKSMGELVAEIIEENAEVLKSKGRTEVNIEKSKKLLVNSGNKFLLDIFKDASKGIVTTTEATKSKKVFEKYKDIMGVLYDDSKVRDQFEEIITLKKRWQDSLKEQAKFYKEVPIDIRISSHGIAKRGLQTEILETVMNNIIGVGAGQTVLSTKTGRGAYSDLLGVSGKRGSLSQYSEALGFKGTTKLPGTIVKEILGEKKYGEAIKFKELLKIDPKSELSAEAAELVSEYDTTLRAAILETTSSYYSDVIDEIGIKRKSLVGEKFVQVIEEPHYNPEWAAGQVEKGIKGERLNIPAYSAYTTIFGEQSAMMDEIKSSITLDAKKHWQYLKALQFLNKESTDLVENLTAGLEQIDIKDISSFDFSTGIYDKTGKSPRSFKDTIMDIEKYPAPFVLDLPTAKKEKREKFYVPGALARETYPEPLLAGERGLGEVSRRLVHIVNMAKELEKVLAEPEAAVADKEVRRALPKIIPQMIKPFYDAIKNVKAGKATHEVEKAMEDAAELLINKWYKAFSNVKGTRVEQILSEGRQVTEQEYISGFLDMQLSRSRSGEKSKLSAYTTTLGKMSDLLVGVSPSTAKKYPERAKASKMMDKYISIGKGGEFAKTLGVDLSENVIKQKVENLEKAKIDYYDTLAKTALGKKGSVEQVLFSRKIPAVMGRAVTAVVDKTGDLKRFAKKLEAIEAALGVSLQKEKEALNEITLAHQGTIADYKEKVGIPVLKQHELGVPASFAKKIPVEFEKKYTPELELESTTKKIKGSLFDLLKYVDVLSDALSAPDVGKSKTGEIKNYIKNELAPYIESVRFPFTGVSSVQPYEPKLVETMGKYAENVLMVPGLPELDFDKFKSIIDSLEGYISGLVVKREEAFGYQTPEKTLEAAGITETINMMNKAISETIPKYVAHQQKLDFDGDQIEIHAAKTKEARLEIAKHLQHIKGTELSTERAFRDVFSYGAAVKSTGEFPLAEMAIGFEKKFPKEKGFDFLKTPFLTKELEYLTPEESLRMLSERKGTDPTITIADAIKDVVRDTEATTKFFEEISKLGAGKTVDDVLSAAKIISETIGGIDEKIIQSAIKTQVYNEKYKDAIEAQLYKIHTGTDTEALYRLHRVAETTVGFGKGQIGEGGYRASSSFSKKFPSQYKEITGAAPEKEFHTMVNEVVRFAIQKGMDVKHAGETPIAGEMVKFITKGRTGVETLWKDIIDESNSSYSELRKFYKVNEKVIRQRAGAMQTGELVTALSDMYEIEGMDFGELQGAGRKELIDKIVEQFGLQGFFNRLSDIVYEEAVSGLILKTEKLSPEKRGKLHIKGNIKDWAENYVQKQMGGKGINIRELITESQQPLYTMRSSMAAPSQELKKFKEQFGEMPIPEFQTDILSNEYRSQYIDKYQRAKATAKNIQRELELASSSSQAGSYADMIMATSKAMSDEQDKIETIISGLKSFRGEGYDVTVEMSKSLAERAVKHLEAFPEFIKNILSIQDEVKRSKAIEALSRLAGVPQITDTEEASMRYSLSSDIGKKVEDVLLRDEGISRKQTSDVQFKELMSEKGNELVDRALDIHKIDIALMALSKKTSEGRFLESFLPSAGAQAIPHSRITGAQKATIAASKAEITRAKYGPQVADRLVRPEGVASSRDIGGGAAAPSFTFDSGDVLSVRVVAVDPGVVIGVSRVSDKDFINATIATGGVSSGIDPELQKKFGMLNEADYVHANLLKKLSSRQAPVYGVETVSAFERTTAGALYSGGKYTEGIASDPEKAFQNQVEAITEHIMNKVKRDDPLGKLYMSLGSAIHEKIQRKMASESTIKGKKFEFEKLVGDIPTGAGKISGFADVVEYGEPLFGESTVKKVSDIKTVGKPDIEKLQEAAAGKKRISYDDLIKKLDDPKTRGKVEAAVSQVNMYLKGLSEYAQGEVLFFDRLKKGEEDPFVVEFGYSEERFQKDVAALLAAQDIVKEKLKASGVKVTKGAIPKGTRSTPTREYLEGREKDKATITDEELDTLIDTVIALVKREQSTFRPQGVASVKDIGHGKAINESIARRKEAEGRAGAYARTDYDTHVEAIHVASGEGIKSVLENLRTLHEQAMLYQQAKLLDFSALKDFDSSIQEAMRQVGEEGAVGGVLIDAIDDFNASIEDPREGIQGKDLSKLWKLYRMSRGKWLLGRAEQVKAELDAAKESGETREADRAYGSLQRAVKGMQEFVMGSLGKMSDIYTEDKRFVHPKLARHAGVYKDPRQIALSSAGPLGEDENLERIFKNLTRDLGTDRELVSPMLKIREAFKGLTDTKDDMVGILTDAEKLKRVGPEVMEAWDFSKLTSDVSRLKAAMDMIAKYNEFDAESRANLETMRKYLKGLENTYSHLNLEMRQTAQIQEETGKSGLFSPQVKKEWGQLDLIPVSKFESPTQQLALHERNIQKVREYYRTPKEMGGPKEAERFSYPVKVFGDTGEVIKNVIVGFRKYGEAADSSGRLVGQFAEQHKDMIEWMQRSNASFKNAIRRVVMWGAASRLVYGGIAKLKSSLGEVSAIEVSLAQLKMVMSPLETDFAKLQKSAVGFAKTYGLGVNDVLQSMKVFAQQGLSQAEVIDRTRVATLAANVTTLTSKDATEALTASMKVFKEEGSSALRFLDAWSETEAKHAITAADMANAIKKSAAAARTAGVSFDELNGIVAAIGSVTRQSGKEVGTAMRFIFRRLFSEKGPKALAEIGIPAITGEGELRRGFDVLNDLAGQWKDLTQAQKLNIAQSIGGTRQYNALIVLMNQWDEALRGIRNSTNSKGSAERRNLEIMKTYAKRVEQTKAAVTELKMEFGKVVLPTFKVGAKALKMILETINAIPTPVKAVAAALASLFAVGAKGFGVFDNISKFVSRGKTELLGFGKELSTKMKIAKFEVTGKGAGDDIFGLKTVLPSANKMANLSRLPGTDTVEMGKKWSDFHSIIGASVFKLRDWGLSYNKFLGNLGSGTGKVFGSSGDALQGFAEKLDKFDWKWDIGMQAATKLTPLPFDDILAGMITVGTEAAEKTSKYLGKALSFTGKTFGKGAESWLKGFADENTNLVKALLPLGATVIAGAVAINKLSGRFAAATKSAQDFEKTMYGVRRENSSELKIIRELSQQYELLADKIEDINKVSKPKTKARRQELGTYESPLKTMRGMQQELIDLSNSLANQNLSLISGYNDLGNAVLRSSTNFGYFLNEIDKAKVKEALETEITVINQYVRALTDVGSSEKIKKAFKNLTSSMPIIGDSISKQINVSPALVLKEASAELNKLISIKNKYPLSTAVDEDIKLLQIKLAKARDVFKETYGDLSRVFSDAFSKAGIKGLSTDELEKLFTRPEFLEVFKVMVEIDPEFSLVKGIKPEDLMAKELLQSVFPQVAGVLDVDKLFTVSNFESMGKKITDGLKRGSRGIATFKFDNKILESAWNMAGDQAILEFKQTADGLYDWIATYFNTKTLQIEETPFSEINKFAEAILPLDNIKEDLTYRMDALNTFVAGAAAGLTGISVKDFKRDFDLGARSFSQIPTTLLLQGGKGFTPQESGVSRYGQVKGMEKWEGEIKRFYFKPMEELKRRLESVSRLQAPGLEDTVTLTAQFHSEVQKLLNALKNNQAVFQFRALFIDLMKEFAEGEHILRQNLAVQKKRNELDVETSGLMAGVSKSLSSSSLGTRNLSELSPHQRLLLTDKKYKTKEFEIKRLETTVQANLEMVDKVERALVNLADIENIAKGFNVVLDPSQMAGFVEKVSDVADPGKFEKLIDINQDVATNTKDTVVKLDELIESIGTPESISRIMQSSFVDSLQPMGKTITQMGRVSRIRAKAEGRGDAETVISANKALDVLSKRLLKERGLEGATRAVRQSSSLFNRVSVEEFQQRLFAGMKPKAFFEKISKYEDKEPVWSKRGVLGMFRTDPLKEKDFKAGFDDSKVLGDLRALQEKNNKRGLLDARNIATASASLATFSAFEKYARNKNIDKLDEQIKQQDKVILETRKSGKGPVKQEKEIRGLVKEREALVGERTKIQKKVDFYGLISSMSMLTAGTTQLAMAMGLSERQVKVLGIGALGTYAAVKFAGAMFKEDLPDSVSKFGAKLKEVSKATLTKEKPDISGLKSLGKVMVKDIEKRRREVTGLTGEEIGKKVSEVDVETLRRKYQQDFGDLTTLTKRMGELSGPGKGYSEEVRKQFGKDIESIGERVRKEGVAGPGASRVKQALAVYITATLSDYLAGMSDKKVLVSTLEGKTEGQSELISKVFSKWGGAAEKVLLEMYADADKSDTKVGKLATTTRSTVLNVRENAEEIKNAIEEYGYKVEKATKSAQKRLMKLNVNKAIKNAFEVDRKMAEGVLNEFSDYMVSNDITKRFRGPALLNKSLEGFTGEVGSPLSRQDMSIQQRVFVDANKGLQNVIGNVSTTSKGIELLSGNLEYLRKEANKEKSFIERNKGISDTYIIDRASDRHKELNKQIKEQTSILSKFTDKLREFGQSKRYLDEFSGSIYKLNDAIREVGISQSVEDLPGFRDMRDSIDKLLGGSHPRARYIPTIAEERMAGKQGIMIETKQDVERAQIKEQLGTATGKDFNVLLQKLSDIDREVSRKIYITDEQREVGRLKEQITPYETLIRDLEGVKQLPGLPEEQQINIGKLQEELLGVIGSSVDWMPKDLKLDELQDAFFSFRNLWSNVKGRGIGLGEYKEEFERIKGGKEQQYRGISLQEKRGQLGERVQEIRESMTDALKEAPTFDMMEMQTAIADPIVGELQTIQALLLEQSKEAGDKIDLSNLKGALGKLAEASTDREKKAFGGRVTGPGGPKADRVPAMLSAGEYVVKTDSAKKLGYNALNYINDRGEVPGFAEGGTVFGRAAGVMEGAADFFKRKRLDISDWIYEPKTRSGVSLRKSIGEVGMGAMAIPEIGLKVAKSPLDALSMIEGLSKLQVEGKLGETVKEAYQSVKALNLDKIKGISKNVANVAGKDLAEGGTGITAGILEALIPSGLIGAGIKGGVKQGMYKYGKLPKVLQSKVDELSKAYPTNVEENLKSIFVSKKLFPTDPLGLYYGSGRLGLKKGAGIRKDWVMAHEYGHFLGDFDYSLWSKLKKGAPSEHARGFMKLYTEFVDDMTDLHTTTSLYKDLSGVRSPHSTKVKKQAEAFHEESLDYYNVFKHNVPSEYSLKTYMGDTANLGMSSEMLSTSLEEMKKRRLSYVPKSVKLTEKYLKDRLEYKDLIDVHKMDTGNKKGFLKKTLTSQKGAIELAEGGVVGKDGVIDQERLQKTLLGIQGMGSKKEETVRKDKDRKWWKFWGRDNKIDGVNEEKTSREDDYAVSREPSRGVFGTLGHVTGVVGRVPGQALFDVVNWGKSGAKSLWGDTKTLAGRFGDWSEKQHDIYSNPKNYVEAFEGGIKDPLYNELMLDRDLFVNKFRGIKDFFVNSAGSFKYYTEEGSVPGGYKPVVTPKIKRAHPTKKGTWLSTLKWMSDVTPSGISGKMEAVASMGTGGVGTVTGGLAGIAGLPSGLEQAAKNVDRVSKMFTYIPQKEKGIESLDMAAAPFQWYGSIGDKIGDEILDITGSSNKAAFVSSLFKGAPALAALSMGTSGSTVGPVVGHFARRGKKFPGTGKLSEKFNAKIEAASAKYKYIDNLKDQLGHIKGKEIYSKIQSKIEKKLAKATGSPTKGRLQNMALVTGGVAARQYVKDLKGMSDEIDEISEVGRPKISDKRPMEGHKKQADKDQGLIKYFTSYKEEGIQRYKTKEEFDKARQAVGAKIYPGEKEDNWFEYTNSLARRKKADEKLFAEILPFDKEHPERIVQDVKYSYDNLVKLLGAVDSGEFRKSELEKYKLYSGKKMGDTLTPDEEKSFKTKYKNSTQFIMGKYMQANKALKNILLPPDQFLTEENTVLHNRVVSDGLVTMGMLDDIKKSKDAKVFGGYKQAHAYSTIDPNLKSEYKRRLESGMVSEEERRGYETKFEILKAAGGRELFATLSPEYRKKYNQFRSGVLEGKKTFKDAEDFFADIKKFGSKATTFGKKIRAYPSDVDPTIKNIMRIFADREKNKGLFKIARVEGEQKKTTGITGTADTILDKRMKKFFEMVEGNQSLQPYAQGGAITKTGPLFAHKGEYILPKGYNEGGVVTAGTLNTQTSIFDSTELLSKLEAIELKVEDKELKVEDKKLKVDIPTDIINVKVDVEDAAARLNSAITAALDKSIKVEHTGDIKAVGAEKLDKLTELINKVDNRLLNVKVNLEDKINIIDSKVLNQDNYQSDVKVEALIRNQIAGVEQQLISIRGDFADQGGRISMVEARLSYSLSDLERRLNVVFNLAPV